ncbi:MAG: type II toxin-antitoxin system PemK/MazF family toxin [Candidatus Peregrinibacteria bacterium]|nr:type II toxin-antitoxin system PemK/MazF family toxin [Candidatus Peregrinibacteria bacterium]MCB9807880.1 type II toxin-antitoxin system PemK/MazF family toxin [Candidatus Peribacteria bacterium]
MEAQRKYPSRGDIWICDFGTNKGSEINGIRPCLIINQKLKREQTCIVLPASNTIRKSTYSLNNYHFVLHQVRAVDTLRLRRYLHSFSKDLVDEALEQLNQFLKE